MTGIVSRTSRESRAFARSRLRDPKMGWLNPRDAAQFYARVIANDAVAGLIFDQARVYAYAVADRLEHYQLVGGA